MQKKEVSGSIRTLVDIFYGYSRSFVHVSLSMRIDSCHIVRPTYLCDRSTVYQQAAV